MPTRTISSGSGYTGVQATIDTLKALMVTGRIIYASDVNSLISLWNTFSGHTHGINDLYGSKDFGNTNMGATAGPYAVPPGSSQAATTAGPTSMASTISSVGTGSVITASTTNVLINALAGQAAHVHSWVDRYQ